MSQAISAVERGVPTTDEALYRGKVGLICFFVSEAHIFGVLIIAYLVYLNQSRHSGTPPGEVLKLPKTIASSICLFSSSGTIVMAAAALRRGARRAFCLWWAATIVLGALFLVGTGFEWADLIGRDGLTLDRNLFGTTYFTLIGLHGFHVTSGLIAMLVILGLALAGRVSREHPVGAELISWYWHFVDGVWVVIFCVVYLASR